MNATEQQEAGSALAGLRTEAVARVLESITDGFCALDREWRVVYANARAAEILGRGDLVSSGRSLWEQFPEALGTEFERAYRDAVDDGSPRHLETFYAPHQRWYEVHAYPSSDGLFVYFRDVTARRRAEEELRERDARFELVTRATREMIYDHDLSTGIVWRSEALETVFGFRRSEVEPTTAWWLNRIHEEDRERVMASARDALAGTDMLWSVEYRVLDGTSRWRSILDRSIIVRDGSGRATRVIGARMDVTERAEAERELRTSKEEARELARRLIDIQETERRRMARDIHDILGQALTTIKIDAVSLGRNPDLDAGSRVRAERIAATADDTITSVRGMATRLRPLILDDLGLLPALEAEACAFKDRTGILCGVSSSVSDLDFDEEVSTAILRIVQEALTNIARHSGARNARIVVHMADSTLNVDIQDDGIGIPVPSGRSLGLVGMRERALLLGGDLTIEGASSGGTVVSLQIPLSRVGQAGRT